MSRSSHVLLVLAIVVSLLTLVAPSPAPAQVNVTGTWTTLPYLMPSNPIHAALLRTGKVLIVSGSENNPFSTSFKTTVWDPVAGTFSNQTTPWDLFCNGMSFLPDGRVLITGGNLDVVDPFPGPPWTTIFDPMTQKFYRVEDMAKGRWYPSNVALHDGGSMVFGGLDENELRNNTVEIYDVGGGWSPPYQANWSTGWYPRMHLLANGKVFVGAPNPESHTFDPATATWSAPGAKTNYGQDRQYGSSVLLPLSVEDGYRPRVMVFGGNTTSGGATSSVEFIDLGTWPEHWVTMPPMSVPRVHLNTVLLPNGKILAIGGSTVHLDLNTAHKNAATFDPIAQTWTPSGTLAYPRIYHHTALLLPDATVYVGGSNPGREIWEPHIEIYKPPYLFTSTGAPAPRPSIGTLPSVVGYGQTFTVTTAQAASIAKVLLMRPGSNTHAFDQEQRLIYTSFTKGAGTLSVTAPTSPGGAPPGYYMLFILDGNGVPSVAKFIQLVPDPNNQPPTATITNPSANVSILAGQSVTFASSASDPDGSIAAYSWVFPGGSPKKSTVQNPGPVTFATPGVYTVSLTVLDNLGKNNPSPPTLTVTVSGSPALGAAITSPAAGATVSGTVNVTMTATNTQGSPTQFLLKLDGTTTLSNQSVAGSSATYAWNTATTSAGPHTLNLTVTDGAGRTATASVNITKGSGGTDTTAPTVALTAPASGAAVSGTVTVSATASDNVGVTGVQFKLDGANLGAVDTTTPYSIAWNTATASAGTHTLTAVATDAAGNATTSAPVTVTVGSGGGTSGNVIWMSPVNVAVNGNTITKNAGCSGCWDAGAISQQTIASGNASVQFTISSGGVGAVGLSNGNAGTDANEMKFSLRFFPTYVEVRESGVWKESWTTAAGDVHKIAVDGGVVKYSQNAAVKYTSLVAPTYPLIVDATLETVGSAVQNAVLAGAGGGGTDTTDPTVTLTAPASGTTVSGTVTVSATASDNVGVTGVQFKLDGANLGAVDTTAPYSVAWNTATATAGTHTLTAVATDAAGNTTTSAPVTVTVGSDDDTTAPAVTLTAPASGATVSGTVTVSATASDNVGLTGVQFKLDGANLGAVDTTAPYSVAWNTTTAAAGTHTLTAVATDAAGNTTTSAPVTVTVGSGGGTSGNVVWASAVNVAVSGNTITKNAGCSGCWDAGAISQQTVASGDASVQFTISSGAVGAVGLSTGNAGTDANEIKFALRFFPTYVEVRESGAWKDSWPIAAGDVHKIAVESGVVKYFQNGAVQYTSALAPTYPLIVDATLETVGSTVQNAVLGGTSGGSSVDTTPPAVALTAPVGGATVTGTVTVSASASDNVGVTGVQFKLDGANLGAEDATAPYTIAWNTATATPGTHTLTAVAKDAAGNTTTSAPVTVTVSQGPSGGGPQNVVWTSGTNVAISGNTVTKNGGCSGCWDAGAASQQTIASGNGSVQFTVSAGAVVSVGLTVGNPGTGANEMMFSLRFFPGYVEVRESGAWKDSWPVAAGDVHTIAVDGGVVKYLLDGTFKYQSALAPSYPLLVDTTLETMGSAVQGAVLTIGP